MLPQPFSAYQTLDFPGAFLLSFLFWQQLGYHPLALALLLWPSRPNQFSELGWLALFLLFASFGLPGVFFLMTLAICLFEFCRSNIAAARRNARQNEISFLRERVAERLLFLRQGLSGPNFSVALQSLSEIQYNFLKLGVYRFFGYYPAWFWPVLGLFNPLMVLRLGLRKVLEDCLFFHDDPVNAGHVCC